MGGKNSILLLAVYLDEWLKFLVTICSPNAHFKCIWNKTKIFQYLNSIWLYTNHGFNIFVYYTHRLTIWMQLNFWARVIFLKSETKFIIKTLWFSALRFRFILILFSIWFYGYQYLPARTILKKSKSHTLVINTILLT